MAIASVYRSPGLGCGIRIFNGHLAGTLLKQDIDICDCNLAEDEYRPARRTILHYVPSMWAGHAQSLEMVLTSAADGTILVMLHGMYGPDESNYMAETRCPDLKRHIAAMNNADAIVLSLSDSCTSRLKLWNCALSERTTTYLHPGLYVTATEATREQPYVFVGGVIRPKKDMQAVKHRELLRACRDSGIDVWVHHANEMEASERDFPVWRATFGLMEDRTWASVISGASAVLCPYETRIQCVSGLVSEAISAGTGVIATQFPFAVEISRHHPTYVTINNDYRRWPNLIKRAMQTNLIKPDYNCWVELGALVASLLGLEAKPNQRLQSDGLKPSASGHR